MSCTYLQVRTYGNIQRHVSADVTLHMCVCVCVVSIFSLPLLSEMRGLQKKHARTPRGHLMAIGYQLHYGYTEKKSTAYAWSANRPMTAKHFLRLWSACARLFSSIQATVNRYIPV